MHGTTTEATMSTTVAGADATSSSRDGTTPKAPPVVPASPNSSSSLSTGTNQQQFVVIDLENGYGEAKQPQQQNTKQHLQPHRPCSYTLPTKGAEEEDASIADGTLQDQSRRLSSYIKGKTEISDALLQMDPLHRAPSNISLTRSTDTDSDSGGDNSPRGPNQQHVTYTSGIGYWKQEVSTAKEHGGDYVERGKIALRASLGAFMTFAMLVFPGQQILGAGK